MVVDVIAGFDLFAVVVWQIQESFVIVFDETLFY